MFEVRRLQVVFHAAQQLLARHPETLAQLGGGYGAPAERDPALIEQDLRDGYISAEFASTVYGHTKT